MARGAREKDSAARTDDSTELCGLSLFRVRVQAADDDALPLSPHDGGALHNSYLVRLLRFFNCGLQDLR